MNTDSHGFRYGSVCSGIEAVAVAWRPLGLAPAWLSEVDPFANAVLAHHYPDVPNLGDMTRIADAVRDGTVVAPDILVGGTPCQAFSIAGLRRGLSDERGALTLRYVELANAIDQVRSEEDRPSTIVLWENVVGVLSDRGNAFGGFLAALVGEDRELRPPGHRWSNAGCVYGPQRALAWRILDAQFFGVAQRRRRVFLVASARADFDPAAVLFECGGLCGDSASGEEAREDTAAAAAPRAPGEGRTTGGAKNGAGTASEEPLACFGGGNTSGPIERAACLTAKGHKCDFEVETFAVQSFTGHVSHALNTANGGKGSSEDGTGRGVPVIALERGAQCMGGDIAHPLTCASSVTEDGNGRGVPIVSLEYTARAGVPLGDERDSLAFAQNSRGELRFEGGRGQRVGALSAGGGIPGQGMPVIAQAPPSEAERACSYEAHLECRIRADHTPEGHWWQRWQVRRLMPLECERLQGLPDHYTRIPWRGALAADGPRYKAIGNSMAVPCVRWLGERLKRVLQRAR